MGGSPCSVKIVVKKEGQAYTIEDHCGDVTYRPKVKDIVHVPSLLGRRGRWDLFYFNWAHFIPVQR